MDPRAGPLLLSLLLVGAVVGASPVAAVVGPSPSFAAQETPEGPAVDNTVTRIELRTDGSARWTVTIRTRLASPADAEEYAAFQARFRENTSRFLTPFERRIRAVVENAAGVTGRPMSATDFTAETHVQEVPRRWGVVTYAFTWTGFAAVDGGTLRVGDAFAGGFFLAANDTLAVAAPDDYAVARVEPAPTDRGDGVVSWTGRVDFADGRPLVVAEPSAGDSGTPEAGTGGPSTLLVGAGLGLLALVGVAVLAYRRRRGPAAAAMTDEERVLALLEERDGRVPQSAVVEAFDWSTSKTSRLLARMAEEGQIEKLQIGRENLIRLPKDED